MQTVEAIFSEETQHELSLCRNSNCDDFCKLILEVSVLATVNVVNDPDLSETANKS